MGFFLILPLGRIQHKRVQQLLQTDARRKNLLRFCLPRWLLVQVNIATQFRIFLEILQEIVKVTWGVGRGSGRGVGSG